MIKIITDTEKKVKRCSFENYKPPKRFAFRRCSVSAKYWGEQKIEYTTSFNVTGVREEVCEVSCPPQAVSETTASADRKTEIHFFLDSFLQKKFII